MENFVSSARGKLWRTRCVWLIKLTAGYGAQRDTFRLAQLRPDLQT